MDKWIEKYRSSYLVSHMIIICRISQFLPVREKYLATSVS